MVQCCFKAEVPSVSPGACQRDVEETAPKTKAQISMEQWTDFSQAAHMELKKKRLLWDLESYSVSSDSRITLIVN